MSARLRTADAVEVIRSARGDRDIVIPSMSSAREWMANGPQHPLDFILVPSAMGHATSMGLGLALAQPERRVIVLSGDGSLLMNLGSLVTIAAQSPPNLVVIVFDNGVYEVTGSQPVPRDDVDLSTIARASGIGAVVRYAALDEFRAGLTDILRTSGPTLVVLDVEPEYGKPGPKSPGPAAERARLFRRQLL